MMGSRVISTQTLGSMGTGATWGAPTGAGSFTPAGSSGTAAPSGTLNNLIQQTTAASNQANRDSLKQYRNLLNSVQGTGSNVRGLYGNAMNLLKNFGRTGRQDIERNRLNDASNVEQDMMDRGLGNFTIRNAMLGGVDERAQRSQNELGERVAGLKSNLLQNQAGAEMNLGGMMGDAIQARQNVPPDLGMYLQLIQQLAASLGQARA